MPLKSFEEQYYDTMDQIEKIDIFISKTEDIDRMVRL